MVLAHDKLSSTFYTWRHIKVHQSSISTKKYLLEPKLSSPALHNQTNLSPPMFTTSGRSRGHGAHGEALRTP
jgi:hypothetical protein